MTLKRKRSVEKKVSFSNTKPPVFHYLRFNPQHSLSSDSIRASHQRSTLERLLFKHPKSQLNPIRQFVSLWKQRDFSIVWGHLGRQLYLLRYYLDLCLSADETVKIVCDWDLSYVFDDDYPTQKQYMNPPQVVDFLIRVEPPFGFTIQKDPAAKHVIVLTSHLLLCYWGPEEALDYFYLPLSNRNLFTLPDPHLETCQLFKPPLFHTQVPPKVCQRQKEAVLLDVSEAQTAHEAYLRLLTGREMLDKDQSFNIRLHPEDNSLLKMNLNHHRQRVQALWQERRWQFLPNKIPPMNMDNLWMDTFLYYFLNYK